MQVSLTSFVAFAFFGMALAKGFPKPTEVTCGEYHVSETPGVNWLDDGIMTQNVHDVNAGSISKQSLVSAKYIYTVRAGVNAATSKVFIQVLLDGKGAGQQFLVSFKDANKANLREYWILPNQKCTIDSPFPASAVAEINVSHRVK